jgi:hypothetical protein
MAGSLSRTLANALRPLRSRESRLGLLHDWFRARAPALGDRVADAA